MRIHIALFLTLCIAASVQADDDIRFVPERLSFSQWLGKNIGGTIGSSVSHIWNWITDDRYNGITQLRRAGALGCFGYAGSRYVADNWHSYRRGRSIVKPQTGVIASAIVGILLIASPQAAYDPMGNSSI